MKKKFTYILMISLLIYSCNTSQENTNAESNSEIERIVNRITLPQFADRSYNIVDFGAVSGSNANCKPAIDSAINVCSRNGGGQVLIPEGDFYCAGPIHLKSNINLHIEENVTLTFSKNPDHYLPLVFVRWEGVECYNYSPYIYANNKKNIAITGKGKFNGNAANGIFEWRYKQKPSQNLMRKMGREQVPLEERVFGEGHFIRPSFIQLMNCENVLVENISIENVPFWVVHPTYCKNVTIRGITVNSRNINNDGIDIDSSEDVLIENCMFTTGDDAIALKSGRDQDGWRVGKPSRNVVIRNCKADTTLHGMAFGSEMSGGIEHIYVQNFEISNVDQYALQFKANKDRGGYIRNIIIDNMAFDTVMTAIFFTNDYHSYAGGDSPSEFHDITIKNIDCAYASGKGIEMVGTAEKPIRNITLENITIKRSEETPVVKHVEQAEFNDIYINEKHITSLNDKKVE